MLIIAETKLDESYPDALFKVDNYHFWRKDRTSHGGGRLLMYVRSDIACDRKDKLEIKCTESIMIEIYINNRKWIITGVYRPPSIKDENCSNDFISTCDKLSTTYDNICDKLSTTYDNFLVIGDLNYDMLSPHKCTPLKNVYDIFDFTNMIKNPTCFTIMRHQH